MVERLPALDDDHLGVAALLGGVFSSLAQREVSCVPADDRRFVIVDPGIAERIWGWSKDGADLSTIVGKLAIAEVS